MKCLVRKLIGIILPILFFFATAPLPASTYTVGLPTLGNDDAGGHTWLDSGNNHVAWGFDLDPESARNGNTSFLIQQLDSASYCNANFVAIPIPWRIVEPTPNNYTFSLVNTYINLARDRGFKIMIQWAGIDYASGNNYFVPDYILADTNTYGLIRKPAGYSGPWNSDWLLCPSWPATLNREKTAYYNLMNYLRTNNPANVVMCMETTGETDYAGAIQGDPYFPLIDFRCGCNVCNSLYAGQGNLPFMKTQYANYIKAMIDHGASIYDIPTYNQVCPVSWFCRFGGGPAWRYAEDPYVIKTTVNRWNNIVGPSVTDCTSATSFVVDMNYFLWNNIPGNRIFTDGIPSGSFVNNRVEVAPWYSILYYGGMGALYWDAGSLNLPYSIVQNTTLREKCRKYFGPLKGIAYHLARLKSNTLWGNMGNFKFWWQPGAANSAANTSWNFWANQTSSGNDYGVVFQLGVNDICFAGTTYGGPYTMAITCASGWNGYVFEKGHFDPITGAWNAVAPVYPSINGNIATLNISDDSGVWWASVYRYHNQSQAGGYYRIKNRWTGEYLNTQNMNGKVQVGNLWAQSNWHSQWYIEDAGGGYIRFRNRQSSQLMHNWGQLGWVEYASLPNDNWSAQWVLENYAGNYRIRNRWQTNQFIHNNSQLGYAQCGTLGDQSWWSAQWSLEQVP